MIKTFRHKGLKTLFEQESTRGVQADLAPRITRRLDAVDAATAVTDLNLPGFDLHQLKGIGQGRGASRLAETGGSPSASRAATHST